MISAAIPKPIRAITKNPAIQSVIKFFTYRLIVCGALALSAGVAIGVFIPFSWVLWLPIIGMLGITLLIHPSHSIARRAAALGCVVFFGVAWSSIRSSVPASFPGEGSWRVRARVRTSVILRGDGAARFDLSDMSFLTDSGWKRVSGCAYAWVNDESAFQLQPGDWIELDARVLLPDAQRNPGGFDARAWTLTRGDFCTILCDSPVTYLRSDRLSLTRAMAKIHTGLCRQIDAMYGDEAPILKAMLLGDRETMPDEWKAAFQRTGIIHLFSVSGLHVGFIYAILCFFIDRLHPSPRVRFALLTVCLGFYALLTGLSPSIVRASIMLLFVSFARVVQRKPDPATGLAFAASVILLFRPTDLLSVGFQLSFGCMFGIVMFGAPLRRLLERMLPKWLAGGLAVTVCAQAGALVPTMSAFGWISLMALLSNIIAVPLAGLIFPASIPSMLFGAISPAAGNLLALIPRAVIKALLWIARFGSTLGWGVRVPSMTPPLLGVGIYVCIFLCSDAVRVRGALRAAIIPVILILGIASMVPALLRERYVQLDVSQALSGVLHADGETIIFDTGKDGRALVDYLTYTGSAADAVFISHGHTDHYGGLTALLESNIPIRKIYISSGVGGDIDTGYDALLARAEELSVPVIPLARGDTVYTRAGTPIDILWPPEGYEHKDANETSLVARVEVNGHSLLWTGDIGLMEPLRGSDIDILQVAHHGSRHATSGVFLSYTTPDLAIISCSKTNASLPHPELLARLYDASVPTLRTDQLGAITVYLDRKELLATPFITP